jgi:hypothetical protein
MYDAILSLARENSLIWLVSNKILSVKNPAKEGKKLGVPNVFRLLSNITEIKIGGALLRHPNVLG